MTTFADTINLKFHTVPYAAIYNTHGDLELYMLENDIKHPLDGPKSIFTTREQWAAWDIVLKQREKEGVTVPVGKGPHAQWPEFWRCGTSCA